MINLYEYQAKKLFIQYNLPVLTGHIFYNIEDIANYVKNSKGPWVAKCQIRAGGRGKSHGICITSLAEDILFFSQKWFGNKLITNQTTNSGELVDCILIEPVINIAQELYISILIDRDQYQIICMVSTQGGVDIENINKNTPGIIHKMIIDPMVGAHLYQGRMLACRLGLSGNKINQFSNIIVNMSRMFFERDLMLVEINPLVITDTNSLFCVDAKVVVDQNSMFRQLILQNICSDHYQQISHGQSNKEEVDVHYIPLSHGNIGCMVNGAGLAMATMDLIQESGGIPANFLDIGGDTNKEYIVSALRMLLKNKKIQVILINIFGGIVCCDLIANSIIAALSINVHNNIEHIPIVTRFKGNNSKLGLKTLINSKFDIIATDNLMHAIHKAVDMAR